MMDDDAVASVDLGPDDDGTEAKIDDRIDVEKSNVIVESPMASTANLALHSPTTKIIGTPFTTESRFEYPFPGSDDPSSNSSPTLSSSFSSIAAPVPITATPSTHTLINDRSSAPAHITSFPPIFSTYSLTHPKMRTTPPPVPPSLAKKRQRWTLALPPLLRRRSSVQSGDGGHSHVTIVEGRETRSVSVDIMRPEDSSTPVVQDQ